jgi:hypothetical protein
MGIRSKVTLGRISIAFLAGMLGLAIGCAPAALAAALGIRAFGSTVAVVSVLALPVSLAIALVVGSWLATARVKDSGDEGEYDGGQLDGAAR